MGSQMSLSRSNLQLDNLLPNSARLGSNAALTSDKKLGSQLLKMRSPRNGRTNQIAPISEVDETPDIKVEVRVERFL